jgi:hypothetical protein
VDHVNQPLADSDVEHLRLELEAQRRENQALKASLERRPGGAWRRGTAWVLLIIGLIAILPADIFIWANRTLTNTDNYVSTITPIIHEASVQKAITQSASTAIFNNVDVQGYVTDVLPERAQPLAGPITSQVKNYTTSTIAKIVASDQFANLWVNVNRRGQERFMYIAKNSNGNPNVDVSRLYNFVSQQLDGTPLSFLAGKQLPPKIGQINVVTIPALATIPHYVALLSDLRWLFLGLAVGLLILALAAATDRRKMAVRIGAGWMIMTVVGVIAVRSVRAILLGQITDPTYNAAAVSVWQALLKPLYLQTVILFLVGAVTAVIGWLMGPARVATSVRTALQRSLAGARSSLLPAADQASWTRFLRRHHSQELWALLILTVLVLLLLTPLNVTELALVLLGAGVIWLVLEFLVAPAPVHGHR